MPLPPELVRENEQSWFHYFKEYRFMCDDGVFNDWPNLKKKIVDPKIRVKLYETIDSYHNYLKKCDIYKASKRREDEKEMLHAEWLKENNHVKFCILVDGKEHHEKFMDGYEPRLRKLKDKVDKFIIINKELPEDVLRIIREYSKPLFTYFREYKEVLPKFGFYRNEQWPKLKIRLFDPIVREELKKCLEAYDDHQKKHNAYELTKTPEDADLSNRACWWWQFLQSRVFHLVDEGPGHYGTFVDNYPEWSLRMSGDWMGGMDSDDDYDEWLREHNLQDNDRYESDEEEEKEDEYEWSDEENLRILA